MTPPPAAAARLDSAPLPLPEKKSALPKAPARADRPFKGIALILASTVFLGASDVTAKYLSATLPSIEIAWIRFVVFALIMIPAMMPGSPLFALPTNRLGLQLMRGVTVLASSLFFISGLRFLPIAEASATGFVAPLFVTALSIVFLGEKVGLRRWIATGVGLIGVIIILRPGSGAFHPAAFFPDRLGAGLGLHPDHDADDERHRARHHRDDLFVDRRRLHPLGAGAVRLGDAELARHHASASSSASPRPPGNGSWCWRSAMPTLPCWRRFPTRNCCGSAILGFLVFGEVPDVYTVTGAAFIVASGLYTAHRERVRRSQLLAVTAEPSPNA